MFFHVKAFFQMLGIWHIEFNFLRSNINSKHRVNTLAAVEAFTISHGMDGILVKTPDSSFNDMEQEGLSFSPTQC